MTNKELGIIVFFIISLITLAVLCRTAVIKVEKDTRDQINQQWIVELSKRGIVTPHVDGSFKWNPPSFFSSPLR